MTEERLGTQSPHEITRPMKSTKKYALVWCSETPEMDYSAHFVEQFRRKGEHWDVLSPADPKFLERTNGYDGFIVSGSEKSVIDDGASPFVANLLTFLRSTFDESTIPVLGICFGAQAMAVALGGKVGRNPDRNFRLGVETLKWVEGIDATRWPEACSPSALIQSHGECVQELPANTTLLAGSKTIPHEIFLVGDRFLGIQGHPEMDTQMLSGFFMKLHRPLFNDAQWAYVEQETKQPVHPDAMLALGRRLLDAGRL